MENAKSKKREIIERLNSFTAENRFAGFFEFMKTVDETFKSAGFTGKDCTLFSEYVEAKRDSYARLKEYREEIEKTKREIIDEVNSLEISTESNKKIKELREKFKLAGNCSKDINNELYESFKSAVSGYYDKKKEMEKDVADKKEYILRELQDILNEGNIYKQKEKITSLRNEWKTLGSAGEKSNELYEMYKDVNSSITEKQKEEWDEITRKREEREKQQYEVQLEKEDIISEMRDLLFVDNPSEYRGTAKELRERFYKAGFAAKGVNKSLTDRFKEYQSEFYLNLERYYAEKNRQTIERHREKIAEYQEKIDNWESKNSDYRSAIWDLDPDKPWYYDAKDRLKGYINSNEEKISTYRQYISDKEDKIAELFSKI